MLEQPVEKMKVSLGDVLRAIKQTREEIRDALTELECMCCCEECGSDMWNAERMLDRADRHLASLMEKIDEAEDIETLIPERLQGLAWPIEEVRRFAESL